MSYGLPKIITNDRRSFIKTAAAVGASLFIPDYLFGDEQNSARVNEFLGPKWHKREMELTVERYGKRYAVPFADQNGKVIKDGYEYLSRVFGDYNEYTAIPMDPQLFFMLYGSQEFLRSYGYKNPYWIATSGYRTINTNKNTEGAAQFSMHPKGKATDGYYHGLDPLYTGKLLRNYGGYGIGVYHSFTHADTGRLRSWWG